MQYRRLQNPAAGYLGGAVGDSLNPGHVQRQLVVGGEVMARYGDAPDSENPPKPGDIPQYVNTAEFNLDAPAVQLRNANFSAMNYTVSSGETLKTIARNVLGDAGLWWRIAQANGLSIAGDGQLQPGQTLSIPKLGLNANNADSLQPYDPSRITGSMEPQLPAPAAQGGGGGGGCGALGKIISAAVAVVVAINAPYLLQQIGAGSLFVSGSTVTGLGAAAAGAAGSIASQVTGNVLGVQDGFSWKNVGLSALSAGIGNGVGTELLKGTDWQTTALRAATGNALTQGIGVVTGLQGSFNWKSVAASAASGAVGSHVGEQLKSADLFNGWNSTAADLARGTLSGFAAGTAAVVARGGRISVQQVATDAFGNALGDSLADAIKPPDALGQFIDQQLQAQDRRDIYGLASAPSAAYARLGQTPYSVQQWSADVDTVRLNSAISQAKRDAFLQASTADASGTVGTQAWFRTASDAELHAAGYQTARAYDPAEGARIMMERQRAGTAIGIAAGGPVFTGLAAGARWFGAPDSVVNDIGVAQTGLVMSLAASRASQGAAISRPLDPRFDPSVEAFINLGKQARHVLGTRDYEGIKGGKSYFRQMSDAQDVLSAYQNGQATVVGRGNDGSPIVRFDAGGGFNHNLGAGFPNQPTNIYWIKGSSSVSVVPVSPTKGQ